MSDVLIRHRGAVPGWIPDPRASSRDRVWVLAGSGEGNSIAGREVIPAPRGSAWIHTSAPAARVDWLDSRLRDASSELRAWVRTLLDCLPQPGGARFPSGAMTWSRDATSPALAVWLRPGLYLRDPEWRRGGARQLLARMRRAPVEEPFGDEHLVAGVGIDAQGRLFAAASWSDEEFPWVAGSDRSVGAALEQAFEFLLERQHDDHWEDYRLPTGSSDGWITAYVLYRMTDAAVWPLAPPSLQRAIQHAAEWLLRNRDPEEGAWGYAVGNRPDADSTALASIALRRLGFRPPAGALLFLERCLQPDGGASTYPGADESAYTHSHADVTAVVLDALGEAADMKRAGQFFESSTEQEGLPNSYWWSSPLYPAHLAIGWLRRHGAHEAAAQMARPLAWFPPSNPFETALAALALQAAGLGRSHPCRCAIDGLVRSQGESGVWPGSALMRVPPPSIGKPHRELDAGPEYLDYNGVLTTATAIAALAGHLRD